MQTVKLLAHVCLFVDRAQCGMGLNMQASGHNIDFDHWHRVVHGTLPYDAHLAPDTRLRETLCSIELPRYVFTNADQRHATVCLDKLGIADCFQVSASAARLVVHARMHNVFAVNENCCCQSFRQRNFIPCRAQSTSKACNTRQQLTGIRSLTQGRSNASLAHQRSFWLCTSLGCSMYHHVMSSSWTTASGM